MAINSRDFRDTLGCFATGITVVTVQPEDGPAIGVTANSFTSVSLEPPLILWCLGKDSDTADVFARTNHFGVNILSEKQAELSTHFSRKHQHECDGLPYEVWETGAPMLCGAIAHLDCKTVDRIDAGDHWIYLGEVLRFAFDTEEHPLLYFRGGYRTLPDEEINT